MICSLTGAQGSGCGAEKSPPSVETATKSSRRVISEMRSAPMTSAWTRHPRLSAFCAWPARAGASRRRGRSRDRRSQRRLPAAAGRPQRNVALVTYSVRGVTRHVLYWGARQLGRQVQARLLRRLEEQGRRLQALQQQLPAPTRARALPLMIAGCDAPDGSHWALQQWQRLWKNYGGARPRTSSTSRTGAATSASSRSRPTTATTASTSTCGARSPSTASRSSAPKWTLKGVPARPQGRNIYVDYLKGPNWRRVNSFLTHPPTAGFCYTFANHPAVLAGLERAGHRRRLSRHRDRPGGHAGRPDALRAARPVQPQANDAAANAAQSELLGGDARCRID